MATAKQVRNRGRFSLLVGALVATVLFAAVAYADSDPALTCAQTGAETVATDKGDYAPEEIVHITGVGYAVSCNVVVRVTRPDGSIVVGDGSFTPGSDTATTSAGGGLVYDYQLDGILGEYLVEVVGDGGAVLASTTFTDALTFDQANLDLAPAFTVKPTSLTSATTTMSFLVEQDSTDTAIKCIRLQFPAGWTVNSATTSNVSAGSWSGAVTSPFAKFVSSGGLPGGSPGFVRIEVNATTPTTDNFGTVAVVVSTSETNAVANQACAGTTNAQSVGTTWDDAWPGGTARIYTATFRDAGGAVITPSATIGVSTTYRIRVALTGTAPAADDRMSYATIALPPCFGSISIGSTTVSAPVAKTWTGTVMDNFIRLRALGPGHELLDSGVADEFVQVVFTATATNACSSGSSTWPTSAWGNANNRNSATTLARSFGITGSHPTMTLLANTPTVSTTIHDAGDTAVTTVPVGTTVHDFVSVSGAGPTPTGTVTLDWFLNGTCTGSPSTTSTPFALNGSGQVDSTTFSFTVNSAGTRSFLAHYAGDGNYTPADGTCETLTVVDANIQITPASDTNAVDTNHVLTITVNAIGGTIDAGPHTATASHRQRPRQLRRTATPAPTPAAPPPRAARSRSPPPSSARPSSRRPPTSRSTAQTITRTTAHRGQHRGRRQRQREQDLGGREHPDHAGQRHQRGRHQPRADDHGQRDRRHHRRRPAHRDRVDRQRPRQLRRPEHLHLHRRRRHRELHGHDHLRRRRHDGRLGHLEHPGQRRQTITRTTNTAANTAAGGSGNANKTWVDANIQITPATDTNAVGTNHVLTITVNAIGGTIDAGPHTATASIVSGPGSFVGAQHLHLHRRRRDRDLHGHDHLRRRRHDGRLGHLGHPGQRRQRSRARPTRPPTPPPAAAATRARPGWTPTSRSRRRPRPTRSAPTTCSRSPSTRSAARIDAGPHTATASIVSGPGSFVGAATPAPTPAAPPPRAAPSRSPPPSSARRSSRPPRTSRSTASPITRTTNTAVNTAAGGSGNASKTWVDANIQITPASDTNAVGTNHVLTITVNALGGTIDAGPHTATASHRERPRQLRRHPTPAPTPAAPPRATCTVTITSAVTGTTVVSATSNIPVNGVTITRTTNTATNTAAGGSGNANKKWVAAVITIAPDGTNEVGQPHTFTVSLRKDTGDGSGFQPAAGETVTVTLTSSNGAAAAPAGPFTGTTNASGQFQVTFSSASAGKVVGHASSTLTIDGATFTVQTDPDATKTYVHANIQISPNTDANPVGATHVFTGHVNVNDGNGFANAPDGTQISFTIDSGPGTLGTPNPCTTSGGTGNCTITLTSATTGTTTVSAHTTVVVGGVALTRDTDGMNGNSRPATKHWADDTVTTVVRDAAGNDVTNTTVAGGVTVHDEATVTRTPGTPAPVPNPTGTVDFTLYDNGTCDGNMVMSDPNKPLNASGTATSANFVTPAAIATFSYRAHYDGDANYPAHDGPCEPFNVDGIPPVTTITLDPANPDACCWYVFPVKVTVSATDVGTGVAETRCVLDPATPPATFDDLPPGMCPYLMPSWVVTDGIHTICAASRDNAGNKETPVCKTFKIDRTPPTSQVDPLPQFQPNPGAFTVSWSGSDNLSGIKDFDVRYRTAPAGGSFGGYTQWFTDTTLTSASFTPTPGSTVCFSVRARDRACWEQPTYSPEVCTTAPYDDPSLTRTGSWSTVTGSGYFGPGVSRSTSPGNKLTLTGLRGSVIGVLVTKQPGGGTIELRWNGSTKLTTSLSAASVQKKQLLTFNLRQRPDRHPRHRPDRLRHRRHRRRRRLQGELRATTRRAGPRCGPARRSPPAARGTARRRRPPGRARRRRSTRRSRAARARPPG